MQSSFAFLFRVCINVSVFGLQWINRRQNSHLLHLNCFNRALNMLSIHSEHTRQPRRGQLYHAQIFWLSTTNVFCTFPWSRQSLSLQFYGFPAQHFVNLSDAIVSGCNFWNSQTFFLSQAGSDTFRVSYPKFHDGNWWVEFLYITS